MGWPKVGSKQWAERLAAKADPAAKAKAATGKPLLTDQKVYDVHAAQALARAVRVTRMLPKKTKVRTSARSITPGEPILPAPKKTRRATVRQPGSSWDGATRTPRDSTSRRAYRQAWEAVKDRAIHGEPCVFCGQGFDWNIPYLDRMGFTAHHIHRIMDGGTSAPHHSALVPAHRGCNARDGLTAQNNRRRAMRRGVPYVPPATPQPTPGTERTSRTW